MKQMPPKSEQGRGDDEQCQEDAVESTFKEPRNQGSLETTKACLVFAIHKEKKGSVQSEEQTGDALL